MRTVNRGRGRPESQRRRSYRLAEHPPDERGMRPEKGGLRKVRRGRATSTPFVVFGGVMAAVLIAIAVISMIVVLVVLFA